MLRNQQVDPKTLMLFVHLKIQGLLYLQSKISFEFLYFPVVGFQFRSFSNVI